LLKLTYKSEISVKGKAIMKDEKNVENLLLVKKALLLVGYKKNRKEEVLNMCLKNVKVKKII